MKDIKENNCISIFPPDLIAGYEGEFVTEDTLLTALQDVEKLGDMDMDLLSGVGALPLYCWPSQ